MHIYHLQFSVFWRLDPSQKSFKFHLRVKFQYDVAFEMADFACKTADFKRFWLAVGEVHGASADARHAHIGCGLACSVVTMEESDS